MVNKYRKIVDLEITYRMLKILTCSSLIADIDDKIHIVWDLAPNYNFFHAQLE